MENKETNQIFRDSESSVNSHASDVPHVPVLLNEVIDLLQPLPGDVFVDGTTNGGGHMEAILENMKYSGTYVAVDLDEEILTHTKHTLTTKLEIMGIGTEGLNIVWVADNYGNLEEILKDNEINKADKLLLDLGFSSKHLEAGRGFSYKPEMEDEPLDMRYSTKAGFTASQVVNSLREEELADIIWRYGEERFSRKIASQILVKRKKERIVTVGDLVECIKKGIPEYFKKGTKDVISRVFQALRIYVNGELDNLEKILNAIPIIMNDGGRVAIISFHSLEDRMVKQSFKNLCDSGGAERITKKPIVAEESEIMDNPKSKSAKLRAIEIITN